VPGEGETPKKGIREAPPEIKDTLSPFLYGEGSLKSDFFPFGVKGTLGVRGAPTTGSAPKTPPPGQPPSTYQRLPPPFFGKTPSPRPSPRPKPRPRWPAPRGPPPPTGSPHPHPHKTRRALAVPFLFPTDAFPGKTIPPPPPYPFHKQYTCPIMGTPFFLPTNSSPFPSNNFPPPPCSGGGFRGGPLLQLLLV